MGRIKFGKQQNIYSLASGWALNCNICGKASWSLLRFEFHHQIIKKKYFKRERERRRRRRRIKRRRRRRKVAFEEGYSIRKKTPTSGRT